MNTLYKNQSYSFRINNFVVAASDTLTIPPLLLRDQWEDFNEGKLKEYFSNSYAIFMNRLKEFQDKKGTITEKEEKELKFMLEALIHAKNTLEQTKKLSE